jgi:hypothetical protein
LLGVARIKTRLLAHDFILANPEDNYFETGKRDGGI